MALAAPPRQPIAAAALGLNEVEAQRRLARHGPNELPVRTRPDRVRIAARQLGDPLVALLLAAAAVSVLVGERLEAGVIAAIVLLNALLGFAQDAGAERAVLALRSAIRPTASVADAARVMSERRVNRLPVVDEDKLVGIVTRADLVRVFVRSDEEIASEIRDDVLERTLWVEDGRVGVEVRCGTVEVRCGTVTLSGALDRRSDVELLERLVRRVPGVVAVASSVAWRVDDTRRRGRAALERSA
jgi:CBS domain-containing protein